MSPAVSKAQARFLAMIEAKKKGKSKKAKKEETKEIFRGTSKKPERVKPKSKKKGK